MPYIILILLFAFPLLLFLLRQDAFKAFTYPKFVWALNRAGLIYLFLSLGFAFLFAWLDSEYDVDTEGTCQSLAAEVSMGFIMVTLAGIAPLLLILNIIKWSIKKKPVSTTEPNP